MLRVLRRCCGAAGFCGGAASVLLTVVLRRWGSDTQKFGLSTELIM